MMSFLALVLSLISLLRTTLTANESLLMNDNSSSATKLGNSN